MKIYIVFGGPLFPIQGMSQVRVYNQLKSLALDHRIVFSDLVSKDGSVKEAREKLAELDIEYHPLYRSAYRRSQFYSALRCLIRTILYHLQNTTKEELSLGEGSLQEQILNIQRTTQSDAIIIHYWYLGCVFRKLDADVLRMIDTHYVVEENIELQDKYAGNFYMRWKRKQEFRHSIQKQHDYFLRSDLVIVNSKKQKELIHAWDEKIPVIVTINGQDIEPYLNYESMEQREQAVCFYGALSNQFNRKALHRILSSIYPRIKERIPGVRLYIVGANPPLEIVGQINDDSIIITGFVEDIRPTLSKCSLLLLPLETGSGFRGRAVEIMALGIPIVGTHNGLQSVGFIKGEHGYLEETDEGMAHRAINILNDAELWARLSHSCKEYAKENFSLESTFGILSDEITRIRGRLRVIA